MSHGRHKGCWSELYPELLTLIAGRLQTRHDFLHFRSVCTNWRSSTRQIPNNLPILSPFLPHKFVRTPPTLHHYYGNPLTIVANTTFLIQNPNPNFPKPWLFTVEELNPGKFILRQPLLRNTIKEKFGIFLDLSLFRVRKIRKDYNFKRGGRGGREFLPVNYKVLLLSDNVCGHPSSACYVLVLDHKRKLLFTRFKKEYEYGDLKYSSIKLFDDIVCYKGAVWTIDNRGRVYVIRYDSKHLRLRRFVANGVYDVSVESHHSRKRLIESDDGLYLIYKDYPYTKGNFNVYNLNEEERKWCVYKLNEVERKWCEVKDLDGRILFVFSDCCFFAPANDFPGYAGNCILFSKDYFSSMTYHRNDQYFEGADKVLEIEVYHIEDGKSGLITTYPGLSDIFWPPPSWLFADTCPSTTTCLLGDDEENEGKIPTLDAPCASNGVEICEQDLETKLLTMDVHPIHRDTHASRFQTFVSKRNNIEPNLRDEEESEAEISILDVPCTPNGVQIEIGEQASKTKLPAMDAHPICRDSNSPTVQNFSHDAPRKTLKRYNIESNLIPTLEKILEKHGDITEGCALRNNDMISTALESLATTVLILKKNTGRSLSESQADYLGSSLSDLQCMRFKVGWLAPFVEMALAIKIIRPLVDSLEEFSAESKMKIIPLLEEVDLDEGLGEGLY